jgi:signal transduction histidine kinase
MSYPAAKKINYFNKTIAYSMAEADVRVIIKNFTDDSIKIFEADFGFARGKFGTDAKQSIVYASKNTPCEPTLPVRKKEDSALFDNNVKLENYDAEICRFIKSYLIIPVRYVDHVYGNIVLCYRKQHNFTEEELALATTLGNTVAQSITINWLVEKEQKDLALAEKQKETETLLAQEKVKTEFIANATHELRTPLAIMKGNIDLALMGKENKAQARESLLAVSEEINILAEILQDLALLTSKNSTEKQLINPRSIDLKNLLSQTAKRLQGLANQKKIKITIKTTRDNMNVLGSQNHLEKLFLNLIRNAITYGKVGGSITVDASTNKGEAIIKIIDDGVGISKEDQPKIFERFYQGDKAHSSHGTHSGLGLAIAKWAADTHGGNINVKSTPGKGSTFTVSLPLLDEKSSEAKRPRVQRS